VKRGEGDAKRRRGGRRFNRQTEGAADGVQKTGTKGRGVNLNGHGEGTLWKPTRERGGEARKSRAICGPLKKKTKKKKKKVVDRRNLVKSLGKN